MTVYWPTENDLRMKYFAASTFLTVSTNIVVTSLITFRLYRARRTLSKLLPSMDGRLYTGVIAILIESAAPLAILGIIAAILQQLGGSISHKSPAFMTCEYLFECFFYAFTVSASNRAFEQIPPC